MIGMKKIRTLIVDDELLARKNLSMLLEEYCPDIDVVDTADGVEDARVKIERYQPEAVFLDIRMPSGTEGFQILEEIKERNFMVVFVTAFKEYAIKAFNAKAVHYVLKPIDVDDLVEAVEKLKQTRNLLNDNPESMTTYVESVESLQEDIATNKPQNKVVISHTKGLKVVDVDDIVYLEASGNCTTLYFKDGSRYLDTRTLKLYEGILDDQPFYRIHKSYLINLEYLREYSSEDGHTAVLKGGAELPVARNRVSSFVAFLKGINA